MTKTQLKSKLKKLIQCKKIGKYQKLVRQRFLDDLIFGEERGIYFDFKLCDRVVKFLEMMPHTKGAKASQKEFLVLEEWQKYDIIYPLFGFYKKKETIDKKTNKKIIKKVRRYQVAYNEIARKNGKSMLSSGIANYLAFADNEYGAEVYSVATKKEQARIVFDVSEQMKTNTDLKYLVKTAYTKMHMPATNSTYRPLEAKSDTLDGLNVHGAIIDEYHAHPTSLLYDVITSAKGSRDQPLIFIITTAGFNQHSPCYKERKYAIDILERTVSKKSSDSYFVFIASLDQDDDPFDEKNWTKANPNLGVSLTLEDFRNMSEEAQNKPSSYNNFLTKKCNIWTNQHSSWISTEKWNDTYQFDINEDDFIGRECYAGLDLASTGDVTAFVMIFPREDNNYDVICRFWIPQDNMIERDKKDRIGYSDWTRQKFIRATQGNVCDYNFLKEDIKKDCEKFNIKQIAYDRWNSTSLVTDLLSENIPLVKFGQGYASMSSPTKELEILILQKKLNHGNNPVLKWMCSNIQIQTDPAGNIKLDKEKSRDKVDGMVALVMALGVCIIDNEPEKEFKIYRL